MEWVETTGRTVDAALDAALDELGVDEHDVEYTVVQEPRGGLLGRRDARVRARVKPISREKPQDRRTQRRGRRPARAGDGEAQAARERPEGRPGVGPRRRRRARPTSEGASVDDEDQAEVPIDEQADTADGFTRGLVEAFGAEAQVETRVDDGETVVVDVTGDSLGLLVGPRGATLSAIEELVRTVVQRHTGGHGARVNVDVGGYRAKRREALTEFTQQLAGKVLAEGREQALEPMSAADRKVVHDAASEIDGVTTGSEGEEPRRRVIIRPA